MDGRGLARVQRQLIKSPAQLSDRAAQLAMLVDTLGYSEHSLHDYSSIAPPSVTLILYFSCRCSWATLAWASFGYFLQTC